MNKGLIYCFFLLFFAQCGFAQKPLTAQLLALADDFDSMEKALKKPEKVYKLFLDYQTLMFLPKDISKFKNLQALSICGCSTKMDWAETFEVLKQFRNLQYLNLGQNELTKLSPEIALLKKLQVINLGMGISSSNQLTSLPVELAKLKKLKEIYLEGNPIGEDEKKRIQEMLPKVKIIF